MEIIGISGKANVGKDFVAKNILRKLGYIQIGFSWPLKLEAVAAGLGTFDEVFITKPAAVRSALIDLGMKKRAIDVEYWVKRAVEYMTLLNREAGVEKFVVTDVRFPNEAQAIKNLGGKLVRLEHGDRRYTLAGTATAEHESETALDNLRGIWDSHIVNHTGVTAGMLEDKLRLDGVLPALGPVQLDFFAQDIGLTGIIH